MKRILISGAGIAGPALALALAKKSFDVTVVERAEALREGGQAVDFRGPVHREALERLGLWKPIHDHRTPGTDLVLLNPRGETVTTLPSVMMSGDVEILRGTLSRLLYERTAATTAYRFGERITHLAQDADGVDVTFARGRPERFDLVVGADGLHSAVRALTFGPEEQFLRNHGYRVATFSTPGIPRGRDGRAVMYSVPGRALMLTGDRALFVHCGGDRPLAEVYAGVAWETPRVLAELPKAKDLYEDQVGTISIDRYAKGRVVLLGDAAWGGTMGGQGTSLAIVGALVLANGLGDLGGYEAQMRPYATPCQKGAERAGPFFAPRTRRGLVFRNLLYRALTSRLLIRQFEKLVKADASDFVLPAQTCDKQASNELPPVRCRDGRARESRR